MQEITSSKEFDNLIDSGSTFFLYKYNPDNCGLSTRTKPIVEQAENEYKILIYRVNVQTSLELKYHISDVGGIEHESPQCLYFYKGTCISDASHMHIHANRFNNILA